MKMSPILMLVLLFSCGWVNSAPDLPQSVHLSVAYGDTVVLPCYSSAFVDEEDTEVSWEVMGSDVAAKIGDGVRIDDSYEGRVHFTSEGQRGPDWSLVLDSVRLSDSNMYECIWRGRMTLSTVWLIVENPQVDPVLEVYPHNAPVTLPCYLVLPRNQSPYELEVWWEKDGHILKQRITKLVNEIGINNEDFVRQSVSDKFPISLSQNILSPGEYNCWYRTKKSEEAKLGIPGTINVILNEAFYVTEEYTETPTKDSGSGWIWPTLFEDSEETTTNEMPIFLDTVTPPTDEFLPIEAYEETATSYPAGVSTEFLPMEGYEEPATYPNEDLEESMDWSDFPWVRTGLIAGVALVTAAALCILGVLHKL